MMLSRIQTSSSSSSSSRGGARSFVRNLTANCRMAMGNSGARTPRVQSLYDHCKKVFGPSGETPHPSSQAVAKLRSLMDAIWPADVGLSEELSDDGRRRGTFGFNRLDRVTQWAQPITFYDIHESDSFTMCIFSFPSSAVIPLHDHPGMTVFSKVLYGSLHVKAYDWAEPASILNKEGQALRLARLATDRVLTAPCSTAVLYPKTGGNLHCFTAITPCAVLDVLSPPYREEAGRPCTYYHDYPHFTFSDEVETTDDKEDYAWLARIGVPDDLYMRSGKYSGPPLQI